MLGHEHDRRLGALSDPSQRIGIRVHRRRLGTTQLQTHRPHQLGKQLLFGGEVPVDEALGHAGGGTDVGDAGVRVPLRREQHGRRLEQLLLAFDALLGVRAALTWLRRRVHGHSGSPA